MGSYSTRRDCLQHGLIALPLFSFCRSQCFDKNKNEPSAKAINSSGYKRRHFVFRAYSRFPLRFALLVRCNPHPHDRHRLDPSGPIRTENLACNCRFLGGLDETWFYIATVEIEARGGGVFGALLEVGLVWYEGGNLRQKKFYNG